MNHPSADAQIVIGEALADQMFHKVSRESQYCSFEFEVADAKEGGICTAAVLCPRLSSLF